MYPPASRKTANRLTSDHRPISIRVRITSPDPLAHPAIRPNYLSTQTDRSVAAEAIRLTRRICAAEPLQRYKPEEFNIDQINSGKMLLRLYERTGEDKYLTAAGHLRDQLTDHPRTSEGAFWHKEKYPWQLWLDGVYMGMPFLAHHAVMTGDDEGLEEAVNEFLVFGTSATASLLAGTVMHYFGWFRLMLIPIPFLVVICAAVFLARRDPLLVRPATGS